MLTIVSGSGEVLLVHSSQIEGNLIEDKVITLENGSDLPEPRRCEVVLVPRRGGVVPAANKMARREVVLVPPRGGVVHAAQERAAEAVPPLHIATTR
eukprot:SAG22_NODE_646_length_8200_cov_8.958400_4_plen_97_part_00